MNRPLGIAAISAAAVLALPAVASAHPSVYTALAYTGANRDAQTRYVVSNHGFTIVLRESNGVGGPKGVVGYNLIPGAWRTGKDFATIVDEGGTGAQAHATCVGAAALESEPAIKSWQDADVFFNYVPFQTGSAGLEDDPARWLPTLRGAGVDIAALATEQGATAECAKLGGAWKPADATQTTVAALAEGVTKPLEEKLNAATAANTTLTSQVAGLTAELNAAKGQVASLLLAATPIKVTVKSAKAKTVASKGVTAAITAQPLKPVTITVSVSPAQAKKLKLASPVLGKKTVTTAADGTASVKVKLSKSAAKAVKTLKKSTAVTVQATSGDRFATAKSTLTR